MVRDTVTRAGGAARRGARAGGATWRGAWLGFGVLWIAACSGGGEARLSEVRALQDVGQFEASIGALRDVLAEDPDHPEANYRLGLALVQTGEPTRAVWPLQKAAGSDDYAISAGVLLASTHFQTRNFDEAIRAADRVLEVDPERQAALRVRASSNMAARRLDAAHEDALRLVELHPDDYGVRSLYANVLTDLGRTEDARREHQLLKQIGLSSGNPDLAARSCLAPAIFEADLEERPDEAIRLYEECAAMEPTDTVVINHMVGFFDRIKEPERATELWKTAVAAAPEKLELRGGLASRLDSQGDQDAAEKVLLAAVDEFDSVGAWNLLASYYRMRHESAKALEALEKVVELSGGGDQQVRFALADVLIDLDQLDRAREVTDGISQPTYARLLEGRIQLQSGDPAAALEAFSQGIRAWPDNAAARYLAGLAAQQLGDYDRAESEFREAVRANNAETDAALELARLYYDRGLYQQALTFAHKALRGRGGMNQMEPYSIGARALTAVRHYDVARGWIARMEHQGFESEALRERLILERTARGPEATLALAEASGLDLSQPEHLELLQQVVEAEMSAGRPDAAVARVDLALARSPDSPRLLELRGLAHEAAKRPAAARADFQSALEVDPASAHALAGLAALAVAEGDRKSAIDLFDRAYAAAPEEGGFAYRGAQLVLASGNEAEAMERLRQIIRRHPGEAGARNDLAWMLADRKQELDLALKLANEARTKYEGTAVLDTLGWVHYQRGEYREAVMMLEVATGRVEGHPSRRYRLGLALEQTGDHARARKMFESALAVGDFPEATDARSRLSRLAGG